MRDGRGRRPGFTEQEAQVRLEMVANLDGPELEGAVLPNLVGFRDGGVIGNGWLSTQTLAQKLKFLTIATFMFHLVTQGENGIP